MFAFPAVKKHIIFFMKQIKFEQGKTAFLSADGFPGIAARILKIVIVSC